MRGLYDAMPYVYMFELMSADVGSFNLQDVCYV